MTRALMVQGTGSDVGKSLIVAGLARAFSRRGLNVLPFKPQNMSNNAAVTAEGGEIGRAQALQARAAGVAPMVDMNPVLLKPESQTGCQVVVQGQRLTRAEAADYAGLRPRLRQAVQESFARLKARCDLVLVEGAGSPAETNLRAHDIANMGFAREAGVPVVLLGDIDRGGVIAQIVGTQAVLDPGDAAMIRGFAINKFRGDIRLFDGGVRDIEARTGWPCFGMVPWFDGAARLPAEDAASAMPGSEGGDLKVVCLRLPSIANFDDLDPLAAEPGVSLRMLGRGEALPGDTDLVILPGSKSTRSDLEALRAEGWDIDLAAHLRRGGQVLGICGGYQMLGCEIADPQGIDGPPGVTAGLGLLDVATVMTPSKRLTQVKAVHVASGAEIAGYEIHAGKTTGPDCTRPFATLDGQPEGAVSVSGRVRGTYLHGLFAADGFRRAWLAGFGQESTMAWEAEVDAVLDALADHLEVHLDMDGLLALAR